MTEQLIYQDQSANNLRLNLVKGAVNKEELTVLCTDEIVLPFGKIEVGIIGASHYAQLYSLDGKELLTEVFACVDLVNVCNSLFCGSISEANNLETKLENLCHRFKVVRHNWKSGKTLYEELHKKVKLQKNSNHIGLEFLFPSEEKELFPPVTLVNLQIIPDSLQIEIETLHAYPNEDSLVFTKTVINKE